MVLACDKCRLQDQGCNNCNTNAKHCDRFQPRWDSGCSFTAREDNGKVWISNPKPIVNPFYQMYVEDFFNALKAIDDKE
jgi:hypothetical protein